MQTILNGSFLPASFGAKWARRLFSFKEIPFESEVGLQDMHF